MGMNTIGIVKIHFMKYKIAGGKPLGEKFLPFDNIIDTVIEFGVSRKTKGFTPSREFQAQCTIGQKMVIPSTFHIH